MNQLETCCQCGGDGQIHITECHGADIKGTAWELIGICPVCNKDAGDREKCPICDGTGMIEVPLYKQFEEKQITRIYWEVKEIEYEFEAYLLVDRSVFKGMYLHVVEIDTEDDESRLSIFAKISDDPDFEIDPLTVIPVFVGEIKQIKPLSYYEQREMIDALFDLFQVLDLSKLYVLPEKKKW